MKIVIQDASVLIDMVDGGLLDTWFRLGFDLRTTSLVLREISRKNQKLKLQPYVNSGQLRVESSSGEVLAEIATLHAGLSSQLSIEDVSALFFTAKLEGILLTGDRRLREHAEERGIETHGLLWVLDLIVVRGALLPGVAADRLEKLLARGTTRLPLQECESRIRKWRR